MSLAERCIQMCSSKCCTLAFSSMNHRQQEPQWLPGAQYTRELFSASLNAAVSKVAVRNDALRCVRQVVLLVTGFDVPGSQKPVAARCVLGVGGLLECRNGIDNHHVHHAMLARVFDGALVVSLPVV